jgi:hypothetical protein
MNTVAAVHLVATVAMAGLIMFVQVVHYPLMERVGESAFLAYQAGHTTRTGLVVVPIMCSELGTALWLAVYPPSESIRPWALFGLGMVLLIWLSTALLQAPAHGRLQKGYDPSVHRRLVRSNWIRTLVWWVRVPVAVLLLG